MSKWQVEIEWIMRRYTSMTVEADSEAEAITKARASANAPVTMNDWTIEDLYAEEDAAMPAEGA